MRQHSGRRIQAFLFAAITLFAGCFDKPSANDSASSDSSSPVSQAETQDDLPVVSDGESPGEVGAEGSLSSTVPVRIEEPKQRKAERSRLLDPQRDGWTTEAWGEATQTQVKQLFHQLVNGEASESRFLLEHPVPTTDVIYRGPNLVVRRGVILDIPAGYPKQVGSASLLPLINRYGDRRSIRVSVKTVRVKESLGATQATAISQHFVELFGVGPSSRLLESHLRLVCHWSIAGDAPRLKRLSVAEIEETETKGEAPLYVEQGGSFFHGSKAYDQQLRHGVNYWAGRVEKAHGMHVFAEFGLAIGDVNGDRVDDLYVCQPAGLPNRLLLRDSNGMFRDVTQQSGVGWLDHCSSALLADWDNDGDEDLAVAMESRQIVIMMNQGDGRFRQSCALQLEDRHVQGLSCADYDADGLLDIYVCVGFADERARPGETTPPFVYHDANEGGKNLLFRSLGSTDDGWQFEDVTNRVGLDVNNRRHSLAAAWEDIDNDGDQDLYVANDYGANCLYINESGNFTDVASPRGVADWGSGMSVSWGDFNRDGIADLYVGNMFSAAGQRITTQSGFRPDANDETRRVLQRFAKGNSLFQGTANGGYSELGGRLNVERARWAWSSVFADVNNDGFEDLLVANGYISSTDERDL